jgi:hypothetical protein
MEQRYMEVLLEEIRGKFDLILEGHDSLHAKMDEYRRESNEKHDLTAFKIQVMADQIHNLDTKIDTVEQRLAFRIDTVEQKLSARLDAVAADLSAHRADTEAHSRYVVRE